jgi:hypothetical protein
MFGISSGANTIFFKKILSLSLQEFTSKQNSSLDLENKVYSID